MNIFRVGFRMERLSPNSLTGALDDSYLGNLTSVSDVGSAFGGDWAYLVIGGESYHRYGSSCCA